MLFNSFEFIFLFLPATLAVFFLAGRRSPQAALACLTLASLAFYAAWRPVNVLIIAPSIAINYFVARGLLAANSSGSPGKARWLLAAGICFNVAFLGYFKYVNFFATASNDLFGTQFVLERVILPLGISFITFQKIAFLVDVHGRRVESFSLRDYALFVLFFPQLIAGPIVHYREVMPQFRRSSCRLNWEDLAVGTTLFVFGLVKKVVLADGIAEHVGPVYQSAAAGVEVSLIPAWIAAVGFTLQIYFDFSGYSDMALGLGRMFGVRLPANFDSPLKATSIIDFWLRWHITLTRFLTAYLYNPLVLWLTRRRFARGLPGLGGRKTSVGAFVHLLVGPTLLTMFVSGLWHGAGYLFVLWGLLHGVYLCINHGWRMMATRWGLRRYGGRRVTRAAAFALTFIAVAVAMVLFRASDVPAARELLQGMAGLNGLGLPAAVAERLGAAGGEAARAFVFASTELDARQLLTAVGWVVVLLAIALGPPNTLELLDHFGPSLTTPVATRVREGRGALGRWLRDLRWRPSIGWAAALSGFVAVAIFRLGGKSEFLYWQF
jgi:D-alanyl-lipoteichoic acid acyltransferase DltB (MBOAT superfamily)